MRKILNTLAALALVVLPMAMASCSDNTGESDDAEFANWRNRNAAFYDSLLAVARTDVAQAKAAHPDNWQAYTPWRLLPSFSKPFASQSTDTVVARVIESAATPGLTPYYTDSVRVNYIGHLMPTKSYPKGRVFDHSGVYETRATCSARSTLRPPVLPCQTWWRAIPRPLCTCRWATAGWCTSPSSWATARRPAGCCSRIQPSVLTCSSKRWLARAIR